MQRAHRHPFVFVALVAGALFAAAAPGAHGAEYFAGKRIRILLPSKTLNTGYGLYGSLAQQHLARFIPGKPEINIAFMPGATGLTLLNSMYTAAAKDGTAIAVMPQDIATFQATKIKGSRFDAAKFEYLLRIAPNVPVHMVRGDAGIRTVQDLKEREIVTGAVGVVGTHNDLPRATNVLAGTKWKIVGGYRGGSAIRIAIERGELQAGIAPAALFKKQLKDWLTTDKVRVVMQYADFRYPIFKDVPAVVELAKTEEDRQVLAFMTSVATVGRGFFAPPGTDPAALAILRKAFLDMVADEAYRADAVKRGADTIPMSGEEWKAYIIR
ncbi:MAG: Bug family tripartite tricarboxylate transporter substrate binding protein, partial [Beijerinckiaceae bacterium]